jgi:hypothetical protein
MSAPLPRIHGELHFHSCNTIISRSDFPSTSDTDTKAQTPFRWKENFVINVLFCLIWSSNFLILNNLPPNHGCNSFCIKCLSWVGIHNCQFVENLEIFVKHYSQFCLLYIFFPLLLSLSRRTSLFFFHSGVQCLNVCKRLKEMCQLTYFDLIVWQLWITMKMGEAIQGLDVRLQKLEKSRV